MLMESPLGALTLRGTEAALTAVEFGRREGEERPSPVLEQAAAELAAYFAGARRVFTVPLDPAGTPFQRRVWEALRSIPYGKTASYGAIAAQIGNPRAARAVGMANHCNPIPILIPCHRVVGAGGELTGYAGGLEIKRRLLELEADHGP